MLQKKIRRWHPAATEIVWVFDSYEDLHEIRYEMYKTQRYRPASAKQLASVVPETHIVVNGRIYKNGVRPYPQAEVETWTMNTEIHGERVFSGAVAKKRFYELVAEQLICVSAEEPVELVSIIDTIRPHAAKNAVIRVTTTAEGVSVIESPRMSKHGEADQKICYLFASQPAKAAFGVWHTCDCDSIGQSVCNALACRIVLPGPTVIEPARLPQGQAAAIALLCNGGDYNESLKYAQISSENLFQTLLSDGGPIGGKFIDVTRDGISVDVAGVVEFLAATQPKRRKRSVYVVEGDQPHKFYRMKSGAAAAAQGGPVRQALPTASMLSHSIADLIRAVVYWQMGATPNSSDFGLLPDLYSKLLGQFRVPSAATNVENIVASVDPAAAPLVVRFPI
jgi:hypothetical protein